MSTLRSTFGLRLLFDPTFIRVAIGLALAMTLALRVLQLIVLATDEFWGYDLSAYLAAGELVRSGQSPYADFQLAGPYSPQLDQLYIYPPFVAAVAAPFTLLVSDHRIANWGWAAIGALILLVTSVAIARREGIASRWDLVLLLMAVFAFAPINDELFIGNVHLLLVGLLGAAWLGLRDRSTGGEVAAGVLIGLATMIKIFPGVLILWLLLARRFRAALAAVIAMAVLAVVTIPVTGIQPWLDYPSVLLNLGPPVDLEHVLAPSVWVSAFVPSVIARVTVTLLCLGAVVWAVFHRSEAVSYAVAVTASVLIAPALYHHYLAVLVVPLLLSVRHTTNRWWILAAFVLLSMGHQPILSDASWITGRLAPALGAVLTLIGPLVWGERREVPGREATSALAAA